MVSPQHTILDRLAADRPTEIGGATAANRFRFQLSWAVCRVLELHGSTTGYALVLDYHDDVLELDDSKNPSRIDFFQIKTRKSGNWTPKRLVERKKASSGPKPSILGKLARHRKTFAHHARLTSFVSNAYVSVQLSNGKKPEELEHFPLSDIESATQTNLRDAIKNETTVDLKGTLAVNTRFVKTSLTVEDHENQCRGRVADFVETHVHPDAATNPVYKMLRSELARRNDEERLPVDGADLLAKKIFSREDMEHILTLAHPTTPIAITIQSIESSLNQESMSFSQRRAIVGQCERLYAERLDQSNSILTNTNSAIAELVTDFFERQTDGNLLDAISFVKDGLSASLRDDFSESYSEQHIDALTVLICHEHFSISSTTSQPTDEPT